MWEGEREELERASPSRLHVYIHTCTCLQLRELHHIYEHSTVNIYNTLYNCSHCDDLHEFFVITTENSQNTLRYRGLKIGLGLGVGLQFHLGLQGQGIDILHCHQGASLIVITGNSLCGKEHTCALIERHDALQVGNGLSKPSAYFC